MLNHGPVPRPLDERWRVRYPEQQIAIEAFLDTFGEVVERVSKLPDDSHMTPEDRHFAEAMRKLMTIDADKDGTA